MSTVAPHAHTDKPPPPTSQPLISVITPSFNQGPYIERCIRSVLDQNYPNFEHLVFDGGSTDQTLDILRRFPHLTWASQPDNGQSDAINQGFTKARGEIIAWINSDDFYHPGVFHLAARELHQNTNQMVIAGRVELLDDAGKHVETFNPHFAGLDYLIEFWNHPYGLCQPGVLFRREVLDQIGPLRTDLHYGMDYDFWLRMAAHFNVRIVDHTIAGYLVQADSKTAQAQGGMTFWDDWERISRNYWGPWWSPQRVRRQHACYRAGARHMANVLLLRYSRGLGFNWRLFCRMLYRRPASLLNRHLLKALAIETGHATRRLLQPQETRP